MRGTVSYNIVPVFGALISAKMVTLHELRTVYTYHDVLDMYDIICTDNYNQQIVQLNQETENGAKGSR